jgi:cyclopropane fatty-acyl-phospholipid synthase-like methyltransferase
MAEGYVEYYLKKLEEYRSEDLDLSMPAIAKKIDVSFETYRNWYRRTEKRSSPSAKNVKRVKSFLESREIISAKKFLEIDGPCLLKKIGIREGQTVMDFGSGNGDYTLILARVVGEKGKVYAVDKNKEVLDKLMERTRGEGLENIEAKLVSGETEIPTKIPLPDKSIDVGWFCDVLHDGYFKQDEQKAELLRDVRRVLEEDGFIAVHPVHMEKERLERIIKNTGFYLEEEYQEVVLFHGNEFHEGQISKFKKDRKYDT